MSEWQGRLEMLAKRITVPCRVLDIGAGDESLRLLLPAGSEYTSLDNHPWADIECDLDKIDRLPYDGFDVAVIAGVLEHLNFPMTCIRMASASASRVLYSYVTVEANQDNRGAWKSRLSGGDMPGVKFGMWDEHSLFELCQ